MKNIIEIWAPKYSTKEILVNPKKVVKGDNFVKITKDSTYKNKLLKFDSSLMDMYPSQPNGNGEVVRIPLRCFETILEQ